MEQARKAAVAEAQRLSDDLPDKEIEKAILINLRTMEDSLRPRLNRTRAANPKPK